MRSFKQLLFPVLIACLFPISSSAQTSGEAAYERPNAVGIMPARGMSMEEVKKYFGEPDKIVTPIGKPPITRWFYDGFVVFFEHKRVIHALVPSDNGD